MGVQNLFFPGRYLPVDLFFPVFPTLGVQNLFFPGRYLPVDVFFPVFPTLGVQNLFFPGRYLLVFTAVNTGYRPKPSNPVLDLYNQTSPAIFSSTPEPGRAPLSCGMVGCGQINSILANIGYKNSVQILNQYPFGLSYEMYEYGIVYKFVLI